MRIDWRAGWLDDKDVTTAHIFKDLKVELAVGKSGCICPTQRDPDITADFLSQEPVRVAREYL